MEIVKLNTQMHFDHKLWIKYGKTTVRQGDSSLNKINSAQVVGARTRNTRMKMKIEEQTIFMGGVKR